MSDWPDLPHPDDEIVELHKRLNTAEAELLRIHTNFSALLNVYTSPHSLVAVSRIRKALYERYP